jgi:hypothetical protein
MNVQYKTTLPFFPLQLGPVITYIIPSAIFGYAIYEIKRVIHKKIIIRKTLYVPIHKCLRPIVMKSSNNSVAKFLTLSACLVVAFMQFLTSSPCIKQFYDMLRCSWCMGGSTDASECMSTVVKVRIR